MKDKPDKLPFTAIPSHLQLDSRPSSPAEDTRCSTPTLSLVVGSVAVNPAVKELALELLKVRDSLRLNWNFYMFWFRLVTNLHEIATMPLIKVFGETL